MHVLRFLIVWLLAVLVTGPAWAELPRDRLVVPLVVKPGTSFGELVTPWNLPAVALRDAALELHDLASVRPEHELGIVLEDGRDAPIAVLYELDLDRTLRVDRGASDWTIGVVDTVYTSVPAEVFLKIDRSLWADGIDAGLTPGDLAALAKIFEYELDFNTEVQPGAQIGLVGERLRAEGRKDKLGVVHAVRFVNGEDTFEMVRFVGEDGIAAHYHSDGRSTVRPFLRSPLEFSRVTSSFNPRRFHPILKTRRPHNGTDFGAPTGTPVRAVADGVVTRAGTAGGHGRYVEIVHDGDVYKTSYSHLNAIKVSRNARVRQGDLIGTVGSSGLATGPHLHFQMWKHGKFVDAMRTDLPVAKPLEPEQLEAFQALVSTWMPKVPAE